MALIVVLSVFNGFENLVISLFNSFNPDLVIEVNEGKTFNVNEFPVDSINRIPGVLYLSEVVEENALMKNRDKQHLITIKGVGDTYREMTGIDSAVFAGEFLLEQGRKDFAVIGAGVAYFLDVNIYDQSEVLSVYVPNRFASPGLSFQDAFNQSLIIPSGVFSIQQDIDESYVIVPMDFARELLDYTGEVTAIELGTDASYDTEVLQKLVQNIAGPGFTVKNRFQQQELLYQIMRSEKWIVFLILTFILIIATFNVIGSLTMLILDKKKDIAILHSMGANNKTIKRIFLLEGLMISFIGGFGGLLLGGIVCWMQQTFGIISLGPADGSFVIEHYPVHMLAQDFAAVFITVIVIGFVAAWFPVRQISRKYLRQKLA